MRRKEGKSVKGVEGDGKGAEGKKGWERKRKGEREGRGPGVYFKIVLRITYTGG